MSDDLRVLRRISEWINNINVYKNEKNFQFFSCDTKTLHAIAFCLAQIGEEVKNISPEMQSRNQDVPWRSLTSLRNKITHDYPGVAEKSLWKVISEELPSVHEKIILIIEKEEKLDCPS